MSTNPITISMHFRTSAGRLWEALTQPELVKQYFFGTNLITTWKPGDPIRFTGEWEGNAYEDKGIVLSFNPGKSLSYSYHSGFSPLPDLPENYMKLTYTLHEENGGVRLDILQENSPNAEAAEHSGENWKGILEELKKMIETN